MGGCTRFLCWFFFGMVWDVVGGGGRGPPGAIMVPDYTTGWGDAGLAPRSGDPMWLGGVQKPEGGGVLLQVPVGAWVVGRWSNKGFYCYVCTVQGF